MSEGVYGDSCSSDGQGKSARKNLRSMGELKVPGEP